MKKTPKGRRFALSGDCVLPSVGIAWVCFFCLMLFTWQAQALPTPAYGNGISLGTTSGFTLGDAVNYAVLYEGNGNNQLQINSGPISGNVGIGAPSPSGNTTSSLSFGNPATMTGQFNFAGNANVSQNNGILNGIVGNTADIHSGVTAVQTDLNALNKLSIDLGNETGTHIAINTSSGNQNVNITSGTLDSHGNEVFKITSMSFNNHQTLTIIGDGTHNVVFNINMNVHFAGTIILEGGLTSDNVLFNITGGANLMGGNTLQYAANGETLCGTFLDPNGNIQINSAVLMGHLFGGDSSNMQIVSNGSVQNLHHVTVPDKVSTLALLGLSFAGLCIFGRHTQLRPVMAVVRKQRISRR